jgi:hypothetical protein
VSALHTSPYLQYSSFVRYSLLCKQCGVLQGTSPELKNFSRSQLDEAKESIMKYGSSFDANIRCTACAYSSVSRNKGYTNDPRHCWNFSQYVLPQTDLSDKTAQFGRLSPAPVLKVADSLGVLSSPQKQKSNTAIRVQLADVLVQKASASFPTIKEAATSLCYPASEETSAIANQEARSTRSLGRGVKRSVSHFEGSIPQGGGLPRPKRMCASDFLDTDVDEDNMP